MAPDKSFGILLTAAAIAALWLYNTGRLTAVWQAAIGSDSGVIFPPSAPGGAPIPKADVLRIPPAGSVAPAIVHPPAGAGSLPPILPGSYHVINGVYYAA